MSDEKFEVAFSGEVADGADVEQVKLKVAQMFKADEAKLAHLFSGKRVVIKKDIDRQTAVKYQTALNNAGALCEIKSLSAVKTEPAVEIVDVVEQVEPATSTLKATAPDILVEAPKAPDTDPLHISARDIDDLSASIAELGSEMQDEIQQIAAPEVDITGLDMAPVGSDIGNKKNEDAPPLPDTTGLKIID